MFKTYIYWFRCFGYSSSQFSPALCDPMDCSTPGFPVHHQLLAPTQTHVHHVGDASHPSHPVVPFSSRLQSSISALVTNKILELKWFNQEENILNKKHQYSIELTPTKIEPNSFSWQENMLFLCHWMLCAVVFLF